LILITGGTGYIGSHVAVELLKNDHNVFIIDNLSNSSKNSLEGIKKITNKDFIFKKIDLRNYEDLEAIFNNYKIEGVIHLAGLKSVKNSNENPSEYYDNNVKGTKNLLCAMKKSKIKKIVFSSSATVYGTPESLPIYESSKVGNTESVYGKTKFMVENILRDLWEEDNAWQICILRYFNPIGAHSSGLIGENPKGIPDNLLPYLFKVASGVFDHLLVFGDDYQTPDGSGIRDYIHIEDLSNGHLCALEYLSNKNNISFFNLGTGKGTSVFEILNVFKKVTDIDIPYKVTGRRSGDISEIFADVSLAKKHLNWSAKKNLEEMIYDGWNWQKRNIDLKDN
jgi:UDP-glucose 4-epimerase